MSLYKDEYEYYNNYDYDSYDDNMCEYCGDKPKRSGDYCSGYCRYKDTEVVPRKQALIKRIVELKIKKTEKK